MTIAITTICINEMEWLPSLYEQHKDWPGMSLWVFVEAADEVYADSNPSLVSEHGLSVDGTSEFLRDLSVQDSRVVYVPFGFTKHNVDKALGKVAARQKCLDVVFDCPWSKYVVILDADEFYMKADQQKINQMMAFSNHVYHCFGFTHIWHPPSLYDKPLFSHEIRGGFWKMDHMKGFRLVPGMRYTDCHQHPRHPKGIDSLARHKQPNCIHMAFASEENKRIAKHVYYEKRGEKVDPNRAWYCTSRNLFSRWKPGDKLPRGVEVLPYAGPIPEALHD